MFIRNRKIRSLIFLACAAAIIVQPAVLGVQGPSDRPSAAAKNTNMMPLRFNNADMYEFASTMAELLGLKPLMVDAAIQGSVEFNITIPRDEIFSLFNGILKSKNAALVRQNNIYQIVPMASAIRFNLEIVDKQPPPASDAPSDEIAPVQPVIRQEREPGGARTLPVATHVLRLDFVAVDDMLEATKLLVSDGVQIITFDRQNLMIITDYSDNVARVKEIVRMLDSSFLDPDQVEMVKIEYSNAVDIADELKKILGSGKGDASSTGPSFVPLERLNAIFVMAASKRALEEVKRLIKDLDSDDGNKFQNFTYVVKDSTASNIAMMLSALYSDDGSSSSTSSGGNRRNTQTNSGSRNSSLSGLNSYTDGEGYGSSFGSSQLGPRLNTSSSTVSSMILKGGSFSGLRDDARVVVDEINNVLHIQSSQADYRFLLSAIEKMDIQPRQVMIDAQIFEVDLNNEFSYGIRSVLLEGRTTGNLTTGGLDGGSLSLNTFAGVGDSRQILMTIEALKTKTKVKILEQPSVLAMDGVQASIVSGAEVPYPTESFITTSGSTTGMNYRETGVSLHVIPRISASGSVTLDISQEVSSVSERTIADMTAPVFPKSSVQTSFYVKDGETVAIAGLIRDTDKWGSAGIPFLSDIPFIGGLFGGKTTSTTRTELIILITPHVIKTPEKMQEVTQELRDSLRNVRKSADEREKNRIRDIEDARQDREKKELSNIKEIKQPK